MKKALCLFLASLVFLTSPVCAVDPHDAQATYLQTATSTSSTSFVNVLSLTSHAVGSGTNSYFIKYRVHFKEKVGDINGCTFQVTVGGTAITPSVINGSGTGAIEFEYEQESIATSTAIVLQVKVFNAADVVNIDSAQLTILGLDGNTQ